MGRSKESSHNVMKQTKHVPKPQENYGKVPVSKHQEKKAINYE
jgi:hypothetical protein